MDKNWHLQPLSAVTKLECFPDGNLLRLTLKRNLLTSRSYMKLVKYDNEIGKAINFIFINCWIYLGLTLQ